VFALASMRFERCSVSQRAIGIPEGNIGSTDRYSCAS
jgi:hypothetical protein